MSKEGEIKNVNKPGAKALETMQIVKKEIFKVPALPIKKVSVDKSNFKQLVLNEDNYIDEIHKIIQRDFFPDFEKLKSQVEYLDALEKNDTQKLRELYAKYSSGVRPSSDRYASPATFETPADVRAEQTPGPSNEAPVLTLKDNEEKETNRLSLDEFLRKHTSEDNESFNEIMKEADIKHRQKYYWLFEAEEKHKKEREKQLALPSIEEQAKDNDKPHNVDNWEYKNKNYIMFVPDGVDLTKDEKIEAAKNKQEVVYSNTRMSVCPFNERQNKAQIAVIAQNQTRGLEGKIGVDGLIQQNDGEVNIRGFSFVKTPSPAPGVAESPLMTWGEIEGTPFILDGSDTPVRPTTGPSFRMAQTPRREEIALALAEKASQRHRNLKQKALEVARKNISLNSPLRSIALSPAAQRLATLNKRTGSDTMLRASYTPKHTPTSSFGTPLFKSALVKTPVVRKRTTPSTPKTPQCTESNVTTDNLLNIPKRPRASDFFD